MTRFAHTNTMRDSPVALFVWSSCVAVLSGPYMSNVCRFIAYYSASPDLSAIADQVVLKMDSRENASFSAERPVCSRVSWETFELMKEAEKKIKRDYDKRLQHQTQILQEAIENGEMKLWESLNDTKEEIQRKAKDTITEDHLVSMVDKAMNRVLEKVEASLQELEGRMAKRQDEMDQRLALEPHVMEIRGFMKTDTFLRILLVLVTAVMAGFILLLRRLPLAVPATVPDGNPAN